jgi:hypothetical protein
VKCVPVKAETSYYGILEMSFPQFFNLHEIPQKEVGVTCFEDNLDILHRKVPQFNEEKVIFDGSISSHGEMLALTREERLEAIQKYDEDGLLDNMYHLLEKHPDCTIVNSMLGVALKYFQT